MQLTIKCFHCNEKGKIEQFMVNKKPIVSTHKADNYWAGNGMYLWDNMGNANYWYKERQKKNNKENTSICKIIVSYEEDLMLDLTDPDEIKKYKKMINLMSSKKINLTIDDPIGIKIDFICDKFNKKIAKISGDYPHAGDKEFFGDVRVNNSNKIIYCIKKGYFDIIKDIEKMEVV